MPIQKYIPIIGLEIHVELKTASKMFCSCRNNPFDAPKPNIYTCPTCLGLPGALPVPNKKAIEWTVMLGLALDCEINKESRFDRKHYFYPDLPKGYQISQYEKPFCVEGIINIASLDPSTRPGARRDSLGMTRTIRIRRVHLEEDTAKLIHQFGIKNSELRIQNYSLIDFNRSGVPLAEIVTEPDIRSAEEAKLVAQKIQRIVRFLGISDADMEKGSMRLEANISLLLGEFSIFNFQFSNKMLPKYKVEIKNINSFRFLEKAIQTEIERQEKILSSNKVVKQQTFGWDTEKQELKPQRVKEEAADYRYFPEPDIPPIKLTDRRISEIRNQISYLPDEVFENLIKTGISEQAAEVISGSKVLAEKILSGIRAKGQGLRDIAKFANWLLHHQKEAREKTIEELISLFKQGKEGIVSDTKALEDWILRVIEENPKAVSDFRAGKQQAIGFLIGQVQKLAKGKAEVLIVKKLLVSKLTYAG